MTAIHSMKCPDCATIVKIELKYGPGPSGPKPPQCPKCGGTCKRWVKQELIKG